MPYQSESILSKLIYIGGIYALIRANSYMKNLVGGISTDVSTNLQLGNLFKK